MALRNWAGNQVFRPAILHRPRTTEELQAVVRGAPSCKILGSGHSFNDSAASPSAMIALSGGTFSPAPITIDDASATVTVSAGATYAELFSFLAPTRWAVHNAASLPHISIGGAIATGTHGSGTGNGNLATAVRALEIVSADGSLLTVTATDPDFPGAAVHVGALGAVARVTLALVPAFDVRQTVYEDLPFETAVDRLAEILGAGYSVSLFTTWKRSAANGKLRFEQVWRKCRVDPGLRGSEDMPAEWLGAVRASAPHHPIPGVCADPCTEQLSVAGPWHARLPHFRAEFTPSVGEELQSEYFVAAEDGPAALAALAPLADRIAPLLYITEVRAIARDELWLSPAGGRGASGSVAIHFTWRPEGDAVRALLPELEAALRPFAARPHWGKLFATPAAEFEALYPMLPRFRALRKRLDPTGKFVNAFAEGCGLV